MLYTWQENYNQLNIIIQLKKIKKILSLCAATINIQHYPMQKNLWMK